MDQNNQRKRAKLTLGRRKVEMKKIEKKESLQVSFTKRRSGLFKKAGELSVLCGSEIAIIVLSPAKKVYAFGSTSVESVLQRLETGAGLQINTHKIINLVDRAKSEYEEAVRKLEEEKKKMEESRAMEFWWDQQINEGMDVEELEEYLEHLERLRKNVNCRIEEMEKLRTCCPHQLEDTYAGLPLLTDYDQELEKLLEVADEAAEAPTMKEDTDSTDCSNLRMSHAYGQDFDDTFLFASDYGNYGTFGLESSLGGF